MLTTLVRPDPKRIAEIYLEEHPSDGPKSSEPLRALLRRHRVSVVLVQRRNTLKEALSWYKAREAGIRQFRSKNRIRNRNREQER